MEISNILKKIDDRLIDYEALKMQVLLKLYNNFILNIDLAFLLFERKCLFLIFLQF